MSYRSDRDADHARISALEVELSAARAEIAQLRRAAERALVPAPASPLRRRSDVGAGWSWWMNAPTGLELTRHWERPFPPERLDGLVECTRAVTGFAGQAELKRRSLMWTSASRAGWPGPFITVTVTVEAGTTTLSVREDLRLQAANTGVLFGLALGGVASFIAGLATFVTAPLLAPLVVAGMSGGSFVAGRRLFRRELRRHAGKLQRLFDAIVEEIEATLSPQAAGG
jgi:hypothetical protein